MYEVIKMRLIEFINIWLVRMFSKLFLQKFQYFEIWILR